MDKSYDVSLREASDMLGKKPATVRSYVRSGRITKQYVDGFNGQEMRLNRAELEELKESLKDSVSYTGSRVDNTPGKDGGSDTVTTPRAKGQATSAADPNLTRAIELLESQLSELRKEKDEIRHEAKEKEEKNFQMAGQLGYFQNQVETLKDQVKQLSAPVAESKAATGKKQKSGGLFGLFGLGKK